MGAVQLRQYYGAEALQDTMQTVTPHHPPQLDFWLPSQSTSRKFRTLSAGDTRRSLSLSSGTASSAWVYSHTFQPSKAHHARVFLKPVVDWYQVPGN